MNTIPHWIAPGKSGPPDARTIEHALATLRAALPPSLLVLLALHLDAMKAEQAFGHVAVEFHMHRGDVRSAAFQRRTTWQASESKP
jgi:hypothetical protein